VKAAAGHDETAVPARARAAAPAATPRAAPPRRAETTTRAVRDRVVPARSAEATPRAPTATARDSATKRAAARTENVTTHAVRRVLPGVATKARTSKDVPQAAQAAGARTAAPGETARGASGARARALRAGRAAASSAVQAREARAETAQGVPVGSGVRAEVSRAVRARGPEMTVRAPGVTAPDRSGAEASRVVPVPEGRPVRGGPAGAFRVVPAQEARAGKARAVSRVRAVSGGRVEASRGVPAPGVLRARAVSGVRVRATRAVRAREARHGTTVRASAAVAEPSGGQGAASRAEVRRQGTVASPEARARRDGQARAVLRAVRVPSPSGGVVRGPGTAFSVATTAAAGVVRVAGPVRAGRSAGEGGVPATGAVVDRPIVAVSRSSAAVARRTRRGRGGTPARRSRTT
jgi:hypothetical protein